MNNDVFPAVHVGLSVSRLGGDAQNGVMKALTKSIKGDLAAYNDKMKYSTYGLELDEIGKRTIKHGSRIIAFFKQGLLQTSSEYDTARGISKMYMLKFLEEMFWKSISEQPDEKIGEYTISLLKSPENKGVNDAMSRLLDLYFSMTKFGVKYSDSYTPSKKYALLKDSSFAVSYEFLKFFHINMEPEEMTMKELYDAFISCLLTEA